MSTLQPTTVAYPGGRGGDSGVRTPPSASTLLIIIHYSQSQAVRDSVAGAAMATPLFQGPCAIGFAN